MNAIDKPCRNLREMAMRQGQKITARDVSALLLAVNLMEEQQAKLQGALAIYRDTLSELVQAGARARTLTEGMHALLEVNA